MALEPATIPVIFDKALDQKTDKKLALPGTFLTLDNAVRKKTALWEKRYGFSALATANYPGGRALGTWQDNLVYMDNRQVESYSPSANCWATSQGFAKPLTFARSTVFRHSALTYQTDTAVSGNYVATVGTTDTGLLGVLTVIDKVTGAVIYSANTPFNIIHARVIATSLGFLIFGLTGTSQLVAFPLPFSAILSNDVGNLSTSVTVSVTFAGPYDVCTYDSGAVQVAYGDTSNHVIVATVLNGGVLGNGSNGYPSPVTITADGRGAISIIVTPSQYTFVSYCPAGVGTLSTTSYHPALTSAQTWSMDASATPKRNIVQYYTDAGFGGYDIGVIYETGAPTGPSSLASQLDIGTLRIFSGSVTTGFTGGVSLMPFCGLASKVWIGSDGLPYFYGVFDSPLQSSYILFTLPALGENLNVVSRFAYGEANGLSKSYLKPTSGAYGPWVSSVGADSSGNIFCSLPVVTQENVATNGTVTVQTTGLDLFQVNFTGAQFTRANLGPSLQLTAGSPVQYDGTTVSELGFNFFPEMITATAAASGSLQAGNYSFRVVYEYFDAQGQRHQSAPSTIQTVTVTASQKINLTLLPPIFSNKPYLWDLSDFTAVVYVGALNDASVFYRSVVIQGGIGYSYGNFLSGSISSDPSMSAEILYTTGGILEHIGPPPAACSHVHKNRLWLGGLEKNEVWFSNEFNNGEGISFSDTLTVPVEVAGGPVTGFASLDDKLVIFKRDRIYYLVGDGPDTAGNNNDYPEPQRLPSDVGAIASNALVEYPGGVIFKSAKGWYTLTRALQLTYIGSPVEDYNSLTPTSAVLMGGDQSEIRLVHSNGVCLVYNYLFQQWSTFSNYLGYDSISANSGKYYRLGTDGKIYVETSGSYLDNGSRISLTVETSWLSMAKIQGYQRVYSLQLLADFVDNHNLTLSIAYDFKNAYNQVINFSTVGVITDPVMLIEVRPAIQKCTAIKLKIQDSDTISVSGGASLKPTSLTLEVGRKKGSVRRPPAQSV